MSAPGKPRGLAVVNANKIRCHRGHSLEDCRRFTDRHGYQHRQCRTCHRDDAARYQKRNRR